jgi:hypothetical protein
MTRQREVWLCNAQHIKNVPGRKTDLSDQRTLGAFFDPLGKEIQAGLDERTAFLILSLRGFKRLLPGRF